MCGYWRWYLYCIVYSEREIQKWIFYVSFSYVNVTENDTDVSSTRRLDFALVLDSRWSSLVFTDTR